MSKQVFMMVFYIDHMSLVVMGFLTVEIFKELKCSSKYTWLCLMIIIALFSIHLKCARYGITNAPESNEEYDKCLKYNQQTFGKEVMK